MSDQPKEKTGAQELFTDAGNSRRFTREHEGRLISVPGLGWHEWDGRRWHSDNDRAPIRRAKETALRIREEARAEPDREKAEALFRWALKSESLGKLRAMVELAAAGEHDGSGLLGEISWLDSRHQLLACANGTINLKTGKLTRHRQDHYFTRLVDVAYEPNAEAPMFKAFLARTFGSNQETIDWVQKAIGYTLTGDTSEQCLFIANGAGANGKSVFIETMAAILGEWSAVAAPETFVTGGRSGNPSADLARLRGTRFVRVQETEDGDALARQIIKRITGGDTISARHLYHATFEYRPTFKIWLVTNHLPAIPHNDYATWRRIRVIPFDVRIPADERDPKLALKLRAELPGILRWAVQGARAYMAEGGLGPGAELVRKASQAYRAQQDTVGRFTEAQVIRKPGAKTPKAKVYEAYVDWCGADGCKAITRKALYQSLEERGYPERKSNGVRCYSGLVLAR
jgi:putative DNA primase/helicase